MIDTPVGSVVEACAAVLEMGTFEFFLILLYLHLDKDKPFGIILIIINQSTAYSFQ